MPAHRNPTKAVAAMMAEQEPRTLKELNRLKKGAPAAHQECRFQPDALIVSRERPVGGW